MHRLAYKLFVTERERERTLKVAEFVNGNEERSSGLTFVAHQIDVVDVGQPHNEYPSSVERQAHSVRHE